ncbi:MAG: gliding motility-associated ABC transporter ATP-binding subunit GldA [Bacteroidetes bacterium]|nr:gliding motility-associated ABC transporter ATP-binding subunit GldA [Bacteroidota bacterium]
MSIEAIELSKIYGSQKALDNISFSINSGEIVGFLGPNGAGKSTTMKILTCFIKQTSGIAKICGYETLKSPEEVKMRIGYLPENNPLYTEMYVSEYLNFVAGFYKLSNVKARIDEIIQITGLAEERHKKIVALSKGYRQRVGLSQALIHNPEVLILDEPTSGLDPNQINDIRKIIKDFGKDRTILLSTHIMQEAEALCDRIIIINKGKIVIDEQTQVLRQKFTSNLVINVEFKNEVSKSKLLKLEGILSAICIKENHWRIESDGNSDIREILFKFAVETENIILKQNEEEQKLEEIFHQLTQSK